MLDPAFGAATPPTERNGRWQASLAGKPTGFLAVFHFSWLDHTWCVITRGNQDPGAGSHRPIGVERRTVPPNDKGGFHDQQ